MKDIWNIIEKCSGKCGPPTTFAELKVENYCEIGVREGNTFKTRVPHVSGTSVAIDCWDLYEQSSQNDMGRERSQAENQYIELDTYYKMYDNVKIIKGFSNDEKIVNTFEDEFFQEQRSSSCCKIQHQQQEKTNTSYIYYFR